MKLIPKAKGGLSFSQAFAKARKAGLKTFKWRGGTYGTQLASEVNLPQMISMGSVQMPGLTPIKNIESLPVSPIQILTGNRNERVTRGYTDEYGHRFTPHQAQQVVDMSGHKGYALVEDDEGNPVSRIGEALQGNYLAPGFYSNDKVPIVGSGLNEVNVTGHLTKITDKSTGFQRVNAKGTKNPVYQNTMTGEYYMTHPKTGQVMYSSPDEKVLQDPSLWTNYHTGLNGDENQAQDSFDNNRGAIRVAVDRNARGNQNVRIRQNTIDKNMLSNITQAQEKGARYLQMPATIVNHAVWGAWNPANFDENGNYDWGAYWRGFGFKNGSNGFDWYGPNKDTVTGFGSRMAGLANLFGYDTTSPFAKSIIATGDVAGNAALAQLMTAGKSITGTQKELQAYNVHGKGLSKNGFGFNKGKFGATTAGRPELTTTIQNMKVGDQKVTLPTKNGNVYVKLRPNGWQVSQSVSGFGSPIIKANVVPAYSNTTVTIPGSSGYPVGYSPRDNFSGFNPIDAPLRYAQSYSVNYEPTINNDPYRAQMIYDASKPVAGSAGRDVRQTGNVTVGTSNDTTNELRSRGRKASTSKRQKNKQSTGKTDTSNK